MATPDEPDWADPCAVANYLKQLRINIAAGLQEQRIVYAGRDTTFFQGNPGVLDRLIGEYDQACAVKTGSASRRRAFRAG
jgi:hypothetical protein